MSLCTKCGEGYKLQECVTKKSVSIIANWEKLCEKCTLIRREKLSKAIDLANQSFRVIKIVPIENPVNIDKLGSVKGIVGS